MSIVTDNTAGALDNAMRIKTNGFFLGVFLIKVAADTEFGLGIGPELIFMFAAMWIMADCAITSPYRSVHVIVLEFLSIDMAVKTVLINAAR